MILILADDLSGAAELAGIAAQRGFNAEVHTTLDPSTQAEVLALDTRTRNLPPNAAAERITELFRQAENLAPALVYKKTDSALRGNIQAELTALAAAMKKDRIVLIPANPTKGRFIKQGHYLIDNTPIHQTLFKDDPDYPAQSSDVTQLVGSSSELPTRSIRVEQPLPATGLVIPDVFSSDHIQARLTEMTPSTLCAGAAEFFTALLPFRSQAPTDSYSLPQIGSRLFVCGSLAAWQNNLQSIAGNHGYPVLVFEESMDWIETVEATWNQHKRIVLAIGQGQGQEQSPGRTGTHPTDHLTVFEQFTTTAANFIRQTRPDAVHLEGGATAAACLNQITGNQFKVHPHTLPGLGCLQPVESDDAPLIFIKPGSYPWPEQIWAIDD